MTKRIFGHKRGKAFRAFQNNKLRDSCSLSNKIRVIRGG
jgi:hypothetical protein